MTTLLRRTSPACFARTYGPRRRYAAAHPAARPATESTSSSHVRTRAEHARSWHPAVDVQEEATGFVLTADLPGLKKDAIHITLEDNVLTLSGDRAATAGDSDDSDRFRRIERVGGRFRRAFAFEPAIDPDKVEAHYADGVLTVRLHKSEAARPRTIDIA
ncbi:MAG: Hsp20/alpha crystallin family protein [Acidobacteriota bacterium]